ncbi:RCC1 domain-containing protein [Corallococcus silvisoli]|uniref:RCC1 domain-containing protein n=1 Tax=Corallococcus silvisoli TaxID=2697031 RepID=UPI001377DD89|nr:RTX toxin [Corallococcus silvisoli]NBD08970.1 RTX toxin [Corallococcus silvisoli]
MHREIDSSRGRRLGALLPLLLMSALAGLEGCKPSESVPADETSTAVFSIDVDEPASGGGTGGAGRVSSFANFSFTSVARIRIDVLETATSAPLFKGVDLTVAGGTWSGTVPFLPRNKGLTFQARATGLKGELFFSGSTDRTLTGDNENVVIVLAPVSDGETITLPRIKKITIPAEFPPGKRGNIDFLVEASTGESLRYVITAGSGGGSFSPVQGNLQLLGTTGTFVSQYVPPPVKTVTEFTHDVLVTNAAGHSVKTTFKTKVLPVDPSSDAIDTRVHVLFNPVIQALKATRRAGTGDVLWEAAVADDSAASTLTYVWSFNPQGSFDPAPAFASQSNPTTMSGYSPAVQGELVLQVTDVDGGQTTLKYVLAPGQFPDNPYDVGNLNGLISIQAGERHTCVLFDNANVRCWGLNASGQLGYEHTLDIGDNEHPYTAGNVNLVGNATQVVTGRGHTCALLEGGFVRCWGGNTHGQLGYGHTANIGDGEPVASEGYVGLGGRAVKLAAGAEHTCAVLNTGKVRCWGANSQGQLGYGHTQDVGDNEWVWSAGDVDVGGPVQDLTAGASHTCALLTTGKVRCWGQGEFGQLGYGNAATIGDNETPATAGDVDVGGPVLQLSAGKAHTCALLSTGRVVCWGYNNNGQLGYPGYYSAPYSPYFINVGDNETPASVGSVELYGTALQVAAGADHTCALMSFGAVKCWGYGAYGQLGYGKSSTLPTPTAEIVNLGGSSAYAVTAGGAHTCALLSTGKARCWGLNDHGQLGYANTFNLGDDELPSAAGDIQVLAPPVGP